jgi:sugar/nucleoside kinase (ribokinase family)
VSDLLTAGEAYEDLVFHSLRALPRAGQELKTHEFTRAPGGGAVITAIAAARLGLRAAVISGLGDAAERVLAAERVAVTNLRRPGEPVPLTVALSTARDRRFITYIGMNDRLPARIKAALPAVRARHVHFAFPPPRCGAWVAAVRALRRRGISTSWDFGWNPGLEADPAFLPLVFAVDYAFLNRAEAVRYARRPTLAKAADVWRRSPGCVVIRLGARGSVAVGAAGEARARAPQVRALDTTGAGDAFNAGFLTARLRGAGLERALGQGNRVGAHSVQRAGGIAGLPRQSRRS